MSAAVENSNPEGQEVKDDVDPSEAAGNEYLLVDDDSSHKPSESEGQAKGDMEDRKEEDVDTHDEFPVQDEHPLEEGEGEVMDEDDYKETAVDDKSIKSLSMTPTDIHDMVSEALDFKLGNFQAQLQQMMSVIQNAAQPGTIRGKSEQEGEVEREEDGHKEDNAEMLTDALQEDDSDKGKVHSAMEEDDTKELKEKDVSADRKITWENEKQRMKWEESFRKSTWENEEERIKWEEYLGKVCCILDVVPTDEKSVSDDTVKSSNENSVSYLPVEGIVNNSWQKVKEHRTVKTQRNRYYWPLDDMKSYGVNATVNPEVLTHLIKSQISQGTRKNVLPKNLTRLNEEILNADSLFHNQLKIMSYASYFLAGLGKAVKGEKDVEEETVHELLNNLGQCLTDACDTAVKGLVFSTRSRRRLHLDAMNITNSHARAEIVNKPLSVTLFSADCKSILEKHQVRLLDANSDVNRSGGSGGARSGGAGRARGGGSGGGRARGSVRPRGGGRARGGGGAGSRKNSGGRRNDGRSPAGGGGRRMSGQGGPRASAGGRQAPDRNRGNENRDGRQNDGAQNGRRNDGAQKGGIGRRKNSSGDRRREQGTLASGGGGGRNERRGNQSPNRMWSSSLDSRYLTDSQLESSLYPS